MTTTPARIVGILNVTPDSFSDGGRYVELDSAISHAHDMSLQGAAYIDVGGESTRPGSTRVTCYEELRRTIPLVRELAAAGLKVSIDTTRARVAELAVSVGASMINDVSGGAADPRMASVIAQADVPVVVMHSRGPSRDMRNRAVYNDLLTEVLFELQSRIAALTDRGVDADRVIVDPGLGFAKLPAHDWELLSRLPEVEAIGYPVMIGASRKSFLYSTASANGVAVVDVSNRDHATTAVSCLAALSGAAYLRVHNVSAARAAIAVAEAWREGSKGRPDTPGTDRHAN